MQPANRRRRWIFLAVLLFAGVVVFLPALRSQYVLDDYLHASMIDGTYPVKRSPIDLYNFVNEADRKVLADRGMLPWWSHPRLKIRFFRPLSSALRWADHRVLGRAPLPLHLHSLLWWVAAVLAARALFRRYLPPRPAWIATIIFALAPAHALPIAWLANREALVSLSLGTLALLAYVRAREDRSGGAALLATALFALSLSGGEYAVCLGGYVLAYEIFRRGDSVPRRALGLLPFVGPAAAYLAVRAKLGYGTEGSGFYSDPFREPAAFLATAPRRVITLLAQGWLSFDPDTLGIDTPFWILSLVLLGGLLLFVIPIRRALAELDDDRRRAASFLLLGSLLAFAPVLAVVPSPRVLGASMLGIAPVVALFLDHAWFPASPAPRRGVAELTQAAALALGFAHFVHGPGVAWLIGRHYEKTSAVFAQSAADLRQRLAETARDELYILRGMGGSFFLPFALDPRGEAPPHWRILAHAGHVLALRRDDRTVDLVAPKGQTLFPGGSGNLFRSEVPRMKAGDTVSLPGMRVTVIEVAPEGPRVVRFELDRALTDAPNMWLNEKTTGFVEAAPPAPGFGHPFDP